MIERYETELPRAILDKLGIKPGTKIKSKKIIEIEYTFQAEED